MKKIIVILIAMLATTGLVAQNDHIVRYLKIDKGNGNYEILNFDGGISYSIKTETDSYNKLAVNIYDGDNNLLATYPESVKIYPMYYAVSFTISDASNITRTEATFNASVTSDATVTDKGICYSSTNNTPTTSDSKVSKGSGTGSYTATLTDLTANTLYYARPYAIANGKIYYGEVKTFTTSPDDVSFTISDATNITQTEATFNASVTTNVTVTDKGICYSDINNTPTTDDSKLSKGSGAGAYTATLTGLTANTLYYARPYAIVNSGATYYGEVKTFTTLDDDNNVLINGVKWAIRNVDMPGTFAANPEDAGMFYQWNRKVGWSSTDPMINSDGGTTWDSSYPSGTEWEPANDPSPTGYRVPTMEEIESLLNETYVERAWTTVNGWLCIKFTDKNNGNSIFLPAAGYRSGGDGALNFIGVGGKYWSSTEHVTTTAYRLYFFSNYADLYNENRTYGFSIRPVAE